MNQMVFFPNSPYLSAWGGCFLLKDLVKIQPDMSAAPAEPKSPNGGRIYKVLWLVNKKAQYGVNMSPYIVCLVTIDDIEKAVRIGQFLVENKLAACVNLLPEIRSIYSWQGKIHDELETLMIIKTRKDVFKDLQKAIKELHPYEVPEIITLPIDQGLPEYLQWIHDSVSPKSQTD